MSARLVSTLGLAPPAPWRDEGGGERKVEREILEELDRNDVTPRPANRRCHRGQPETERGPLMA